MPASPQRPCRKPGCNRLTANATGYCDKHIVAHLDDLALRNAASRASAPEAARFAAELRSSSIWRDDFQPWFTSQYPLCCDPFGEHARRDDQCPTDSVHHIEPVISRPDLLCVASNCRPVCDRCHARLSGMERNGGDTAHLFTFDHWLAYLALLHRDFLTDAVAAELRGRTA